MKAGNIELSGHVYTGYILCVVIIVLLQYKLAISN